MSSPLHIVMLLLRIIQKGGNKKKSAKKVFFPTPFLFCFSFFFFVRARKGEIAKVFLKTFQTKPYTLLIAGSYTELHMEIDNILH